MSLHMAGWRDALMKRDAAIEDADYLAGWKEGMRYRYHKAVAEVEKLHVL